MQQRIVTISRQYGSGGRQIGALLAQKLGIPFYDKELLALAAEQSGVAGGLFAQPEESNYLFRDFSMGIGYEPPLSDKIYLAQAAVLRTVAERGPCVIVGRGAGAVLKDTAPLLNVFIYASLEARKKRAVEEYGDPDHRIEARMAAIDKKRAGYFRFYTGVNGRRMENYHLCIDSGFIGIGHAAAMIEAAYRMAE